MIEVEAGRRTVDRESQREIDVRKESVI